MMTPQDNPTFAFWKKCCPPRCCTLCTPPTTHSAQGAQPCLVLLLSPTPAVLVGAKQHLIVVFTSTSLKTNNTLHTSPVGPGFLRLSSLEKCLFISF